MRWCKVDRDSRIMGHTRVSEGYSHGSCRSLSFTRVVACIKGFPPWCSGYLPPLHRWPRVQALAYSADN